MRACRHAAVLALSVALALQGGEPSAGLQPPEADSSAWRIVVDRDGMHRLTQARLQAAGADTDSIDPATLALSSRGREAPIFVRGGDDGRFGPGDEIVFHGQRNRGEGGRWFDPYTDGNVYRLTWSGRPGRRMTLRPAFPPGADASAPARRVFPERVHIERDDHFFGLAFARENAGPGFETVAGGVLRRDGGRYRLPPLPNDSWYWTPLNSTGRHSLAFHLPGLAGPSPQRDPYQARLRVMLRGLTDQPQMPDHRTRILLDGEVLLEDALWDGQSEYLFVSASLPQTLLRAGRNRLHIDKLPVASGEPYRLLLNWIAVDYWRELRAQDDALRFSLSGPGKRPAAVSGFSRPDIELYSAHGERFTDLDVGLDDQEQGTWSVRFVPEATDPDAPRDYLALTRDRLLEPKAVSRDRPSHLRAAGQGADYLIIAHASLMDGARALAAHRRARGLEVRVVDVQDIYDEFSHGVFDPHAIRAFLAHAHAHWTPAPAYVLLAGDADLDYRRGRNLVPTLQAQTLRYGAAASDNRFVSFGDDPLPRMRIGRLPAASPDELARMVTRIIAYERAPPPGPWRRRALWVADSSPRTGLVFVGQIEALIRDRLHPAFRPQRIYSTAAAALPPTLHPFVGGRDQVIDGFARGAALVTYLGHGAGGLWRNGATLLDVDDAGRLAGGGRRPFVLSMTCLTAAFDHNRRRTLGEELLLADNGGAIAFLGSTSNSWVRDQFLFVDEILTLLSEGGERTVGNVVLDAKRRYLARHPSGVDLVETFTLLGDPALELALPKPALELAVAPKTAASGEALVVSGRVGGNFEGQVEIALFDDGAERVEVDGAGQMTHYFKDAFPQRRLLGWRMAPVTAGRFRARLKLPAEALPGEVGVAAYAWGDSADAIGQATFTVAPPGAKP